MKIIDGTTRCVRLKYRQIVKYSSTITLVNRATGVIDPIFENFHLVGYNAVWYVEIPTDVSDEHIAAIVRVE
jgi:hypothetical protein